MAEGGGPTLEARLIARLLDIFPEYGEQVIRDSVYSALVETNGAINIHEEVLVNQCIDALLMPAPPTNAVGAKRVATASGTEDAKRARPGSVADSPNSSMRSEGSANDSDAAGPAVPVNHAELEKQMRFESNRKMITDMFPWIHPPWVTERLSEPNFNVDLLIDHILANQSNIPKKEKPKPKPAPSAAAGSASGTKNDNPKNPVAKDYLNDYADYANNRNLATQYLSSQFPWLYMDGITNVLYRFNYHLAPAYNVLLQATKDLDLKHVGSVQAKIVKAGVPDEILNLRVLKTRRSTAIRPIPAQLQDEVAWIQKHFHGQNDNAVQADAASLTDKPQTDDELKLERARERGDVYECGICCGEYIISEQMVACADGHLFCNECLRNYSREAIYGQTKADLFCMNDDCKARFPHDMVIKALDADAVKKLEEKRAFEALNTADIEGLEKCKYCNYAIIFDVPPEVNKVFKCGDPSCEREYCRICQVDWEEHIGKPCKEVENEDDTRKRREAEERMAAAVIRNCNKCKAPLIKEEGCNKLICSCGAIMCYLCRQSIKGYDHFCQHARDPSKPGCQLCTNCSLWEDPKLKDSVVVKQIQTEATKALTDSGKELKVGVEEASPVRGNKQQAIRRPQAPANRRHGQQPRQHYIPPIQQLDLPYIQPIEQVQQQQPRPAAVQRRQVQPAAQAHIQQPGNQQAQAQQQAPYAPQPNAGQGQQNRQGIVGQWQYGAPGWNPLVPAQIPPPVVVGGVYPNPPAQGNAPMQGQHHPQNIPRPVAHGGARPRDYYGLANVVPQLMHNYVARQHGAPNPPNQVVNAAPVNFMPPPQGQARMANGGAPMNVNEPPRARH